MLMVTYIVKHVDGGRLLDNEKNVSPISFPPNKVLTYTLFSEKATKFCEIFTLLLTVCTLVKSKVKILQNFVAFLEYMNFKMKIQIFRQN